MKIVLCSTFLSKQNKALVLSVCIIEVIEKQEKKLIKKPQKVTFL